MYVFEKEMRREEKRIAGKRREEKRREACKSKVK
jgi:hypothetical protein